MRTFNKGRLVLLAVLLFLLGGCMGQKDAMEVSFLDVGKADAAVLLTQNACVVIDTGEDENGQDVVDVLKAQGRDTIDLLILTHFDKDHIGGADTVLSKCGVKRVIVSDYPRDSGDYDEYLAAMETAGLTAEQPKTETKISLGGMELTVWPPEQTTYDADPSNNSSLMVSVTYGETSLLFAGDAQTARVEEFLQAHTESYEVLKVPHHGAWEAAYGPFFETVHPAYAVITSSKKEQEDSKTVDALEALGTNVYLTRNGTVTMACDGKHIFVRQN